MQNRSTSEHRNPGVAKGRFEPLLRLVRAIAAWVRRYRSGHPRRRRVKPPRHFQPVTRHSRFIPHGE